jgi:hypothetical protein
MNPNKFLEQQKYYEAAREFLHRFQTNPAKLHKDDIGSQLSADELQDLGLAISSCTMETRTVHKANVKSFWSRLLSIVELYKTDLSQLLEFELYPFIVESFAKNKLIKPSNNSWQRSAGPPRVHLGEVVQCISNALGCETAEVRSAFLVHNIVAASTYYQNIYLDALAALLDVAPRDAERAVAKLIIDKTIDATIDKLAENSSGGDSCLIEFSGATTDSNFNDSLFRLCSEVSNCVETAQSK